MLNIHQSLVHTRRIRKLASHLARMIGPGHTVLDIGCGDGALSRLVMNQRSDLEIKGIDVLVRDHVAIPVRQYDGSRIPYDDNSFHTIILIDVLHHVDDISSLLKEASRVASHNVIIKDHLNHNAVSERLLRFMDHVGNAHHGVPCPGNYLSPISWTTLFNELTFSEVDRLENLKMYPWYADWLFGGKLHFVSKLQLTKT